MNLDRWKEVKHLVQELLELKPSEREVRLSEVDLELRAEAEALLNQPSATLPPAPAALLGSMDSFSFRPGDRVAHYVIMKLISRGGMGAVYLAEDSTNSRTVALKLLSPRSERYTVHEHLALARLTHPNIATLYESGTTDDGLRYVAMEYVEGVPITTYCERHCPTIRSRLLLFQKVCDAVAYAHQQFVLHRDLKPDNILVSPEGEPKLLDFGIAKILPTDAGAATLTQIQERPFTLAFASPEQISGQPMKIPSDVYSLGVLLCLLLTGGLPYHVKSGYDLPWVIRNVEPNRPSELLPKAGPPGLSEGNPRKLRRLIRGDLDAIVLRALRKEPEQRYPTVSQFSEDVRRYLDQEPVLALRGTRRYLAYKFMRRHRVGAFASLAAASVLVAFVTALLVQQRETLRERDRARQQASRAEAVQQFLVDMFHLPSARKNSGRDVTVREVLGDARVRLDGTLPNDPEIRGTLRQALGTIHLNIGSYAPAEALLAPALADLTATYGEHHPLVIQTMANVAKLHYYHALYAEAERLAQQTLSLLGSPVRDDKYLREDLLSLLGHIAFGRGEYQKAERLFRQVLASQSRFHFGTITRWYAIQGDENDLACALHAQGKLADAEKLYRDALGIRHLNFRDKHRDSIQAAHNLALLLFDQGKTAEAADSFKKLRGYQESVLGWHDALYALSLHNMASVLLSTGDYRNAEILLTGSLDARRRILPDNHPDIARSIAEYGRLVNLTRGAEAADWYYRDSLQQLDRVLGIHHTDRIPVANNLAVALAERRRLREAESLWQALLVQVREQAVRKVVRDTVHRNFSILLASQGRIGEAESLLGRKHTPAANAQPAAAYQLLGLTTPALTDFHQSSTERHLYLGPPDIAADTTLLHDSFDDGVLAANIWEVGGRSVREENGELHITTDATDYGGQARTRPIVIDPKKPIIIKRRVKVHPANSYFGGQMMVNITGYPERRFVVSYSNYRYEGMGEAPAVGFSISRFETSPHHFYDRKTHTSEFVKPIWDRWFNEEVVYHPNGDLMYFIDNDLKLLYKVGPLPPTAESITLTLHAWGWYTGHYHYLDDLQVQQGAYPIEGEQSK